MGEEKVLEVHEIMVVICFLGNEPRCCGGLGGNKGW